MPPQRLLDHLSDPLLVNAVGGATAFLCRHVRNLRLGYRCIRFAPDESAAVSWFMELRSRNRPGVETVGVHVDLTRAWLARMRAARDGDRSFYETLEADLSLLDPLSLKP